MATVEMGNETDIVQMASESVPKSAEIVSSDVRIDESNPSNVFVTFVISAKSPRLALDFADSDELVMEGLKLSKKEGGISSVGLSDKSKPMPCDEEGKADTSLYFKTYDPSVGKTYFYTTTLRFIGTE